MEVIEQYYQWEQVPISALEIIETAGRTCYKSEELARPGSSKEFVERIVRRGHLSVIEHVSASVRFTTDRGVTHELVRHRLCAFSQESTRYCNYGNGHVKLIRPVWCSSDVLGQHGAVPDSPTDPERIWLAQMLCAEASYKTLLKQGWRPEQARAVLPNSLKTEIVVTANLREWAHILQLRCSRAAHPQIRELMKPLLEDFRGKVPFIFNELVEW